MNKLIPFLAFALFILVGCAKEEMTTETLSTGNDQVNESTFWSVNYDGENLLWELFTLNEQPTKSASPTNRSNSAHAHGNYTGFGGTTTIDFSGTQNNGGAHGSAEVQQAFGPFEANYLVETTSMVVDGNYAIYGGIITEVITNTFPAPPPPPPGVPAPPCNPNSVGNYVYFTVYDNGQGSNAPADQYRGLAQSCSIRADAGVNFPWFIFGPPSDVMNESDKIKVN